MELQQYYKQILSNGEAIPFQVKGPGTDGQLRIMSAYPIKGLLQLTDYELSKDYVERMIEQKEIIPIGKDEFDNLCNLYITHQRRYKTVNL